MSLLDKATIITTPTAHSNGVLHSIKGGSVADFDVVRGSAATRVNAEGLIEDISILSGELITNGDFSNGSTDWTLGTGWSVGADKATFDGGSDANIIQTTAGITIGNTFKVTLDVSDMANGEISVRLGGGAATEIARIQSNGSYVFYGVAISSNITFRALLSFDGSIDNISVKEVTDATNIPRIDYTGGTASILLEPQSTNLITHSEDFSNAYWTKLGASVSNSFISPDGADSAYKIVEDTSNGTHRIANTAGFFVSGETQSFSCFAKKGERDFIHIAASSSATLGINSYFDLTNGVIGTNTSGTASIEDYGNGWYRCSIVGVSSNTGGTAISIYSAITDNSNSYQGDGTSGVYIWGAQREALPYATSYIPTSGAIATRLADSVTGAGDATTFNSTEGVLYFEGSALTNGKDSRISLSDGTLNNRVSFAYSPTANESYCLVRFNGVQVIQVLNLPLGGSQTENIKVAIKYKSGDSKIFINGVSVLSSSVTYSAASPDLSELKLKDSTGGIGFEGKLKSVITFNTALTDAELECLTTI